MKVEIVDPQEVNATILKWVSIIRENLLLALKKIGLSIAGTCLSGLLFLTTLKLPVLAKAMPLSFIVLFVAGSVTLLRIAAYLQERDELKNLIFKELFPLVARSVGEIAFTENPTLTTCFPHEFLRDRVNGSCLLEINCKTDHSSVGIGVVLLVRSNGKKAIEQRFLTINWLSTFELSRCDVGFSTVTKPVFFQLPRSIPSELFSTRFGEDGSRLPAILYTSDALSPNTRLNRLYEWMDKAALKSKSDDISFYSDGLMRHINVPVNSNLFNFHWSASEAVIVDQFHDDVQLLQILIDISKSLDETVRQL